MWDTRWERRMVYFWKAPSAIVGVSLRFGAVPRANPRTRSPGLKVFTLDPTSTTSPATCIGNISLPREIFKSCQTCFGSTEESFQLE